MQAQIYTMAIQLFNTGIQIINIANQIPDNPGMDIMNLKKQIQNIGFQIQNLGNQINVNNINNNMMMKMNYNMGIQNNNMMMSNINQNEDEDEEWLEGFKIGVEEASEKNNKIPKKNLLFTTTIGSSRNLLLDYWTTVGDSLRKYLLEINRPELINTDKISFFFNAKKLRFDDETKIEIKFQSAISPRIVVNI